MILCLFSRVGLPLVPIYVQVIVPDNGVKFGSRLVQWTLKYYHKLIGYFIKIAATMALVVT